MSSSNKKNFKNRLKQDEQTSRASDELKQSDTKPSRNDPAMTILRLSPSNNWASWQRDNEIYFATKYEQYGSFFETLKPFVPETPTKPKVRARNIGPTEKKGTETKSKRMTNTGKTKPLKNIDDDDADNDDDSSSSSSYASSSDYESEDDEEGNDIVETEEDAVYIYRKRLEGVERERRAWKSYKPAMFADLLRSLGSEARALVEASRKFEKAKAPKDPVLLLKICHKKLRHYSSSRGVTREVRSAKSLYNIHQWASEHTSDYYQRFTREVEEYETFHEETVNERVRSALFTEGLHNSRYGGLKIDIENGVLRQKSSLPSAYNQALKYKIRNTEGNGRTTGILASSFLTSTRRSQNSDTAANKDDKVEGTVQTSRVKDSGGKGSFKFPCTTCKLLGITSNDHRAHECPNEKKAADMLAESTMFTSVINEVESEESDGHDKHMINMIRAATTDTITSTYASSLAAVTQDLNRNEIVFDSGSTINIFQNEELLDAGSSRECRLGNISTYGGEASAATKGTFKGIATYVNTNGPANLISQSRCLEYGCRVQYNEDSDEYGITFPNEEVMTFRQRKDLGGLYVYTPPSTFATVKEKLKLYTRREQGRALAARQLVPNLGFPSDKDYASMLNNNIIRNMDVTSADVYRAHKIFGRDVPSYMGKKTRSSRNEVVTQKTTAVIAKTVKLGLDVFFVNHGAYMLSHSSFAYKMVSYMGLHNKTMTNNASEFWFHIKTHVNAYRARGFTVTEIEADDEKAFLANRTNIEADGIKFSPKFGSKVEECERAIRTIKERHRAYVFHLPFPLTHLMERYLVLNCARLINAYPTYGEGYEGIPPTEIYRGTKLDWRIDFPVAFGDVCLIPNDVKENESKTSKPRGLVAIALMPIGNAGRDILFLNVATMRTVVRNEFTVIPTPQYVIEHINELTKDVVKSRSRDPVYQNSRGVTLTTGTAMDADTSDHLEDAGISELHIRRETPEQLIEIDDNMLDELDPDQHPTPEDQDNIENEDGLEHHVTKGEDTDTIIEPNEDLDGSNVPVVSIDDLNQRYPSRGNRTTWKERSYFGKACLNTTINQQLNLEPRQRIKAMVKEIMAVAVDKKAFTPIVSSNLSYKDMKKVISSKLFTKAKFSPNGEFDKWKARLVAGGHLQDRGDYSMAETSSPTVTTTSIFTVAAIAAKERRHTCTVDFTAAYLNAKLPEDKVIMMRLGREVSSILSIMVPDYKAYLREDGTMIVRLDKALYGCIESAKLWYNDIKETLLNDGFKRNEKDHCIFNKIVEEKQITICVYVDDLFITCEQEQTIHNLVNMLKGKYTELSFTLSKQLKYLGMMFDFTVSGQAKITMPKMVNDIIKDLDISGSASTPAGTDLFVTKETDTKLTTDEKEKFHSSVMRMQYLAKRCRPDILLPVVYLSSRVLKCTNRDMKNLQRIAKYLNGTKEMSLNLQPDDCLINIHTYVDSSFAVHTDFKSHTGCMITFGCGGIFFKSTKQKLATKSSTEAELVGVSDALTTVIWLRDFLIEQGYDMGPAVLYQDNMSTIAMINNGTATNERTRHINIRFFFVHDRVKKGEIAVKYMPTESMLADMFTKPLQGESFKTMRDKILNNSLD